MKKRQKEGGWKRGEGSPEWTEAAVEEGGGKQGEKGGEGMKGGKQCFIENGWTNSV